MAININRDRNTSRQRTRTVFVPVGGGGSKIETSELSVSENGTYEAGEDKAYSKVTVKVTEPLGTVKIADYGIKFANSSFSELPEWADFEGVTDMSKMFEFCNKLQSIPSLDTSQVTTMSGMFYYCFHLQSIPSLDTSQVTNMAEMFYDCEILQTIPQLDTSKVTTMESMFFSCNNLQTLPQLDTSKVTKMGYMFNFCRNLTDLGGFVGLKANLDLSYSKGLTHDSIMNVINKTADVTASPKTLTLGSTNLAKITDEEKAVATNKGWTLA